MKTKEAFTKWFCEVWDLYPFTYERLLKGEAVLNYEYAFKFDIQNKAWEAACEYKDKLLINGTRMKQMNEEIETLKAENIKLKPIVMLAAEASCYTEYEDACSAARRCLKELEDK